jgi:hypothetical protein
MDVLLYYMKRCIALLGDTVDTERKLLDKRNEKRQAVKRRVLEEMKAIPTEK